MKNKLAVSEVFYSMQGEGPTTGVPSVFVRLGGCNLMCGGLGTQIDKKLHNGAEWRCDTIEVWMQATAKEFSDILPPDCVEAIAKGAHIILTGGEPLLQEKKLIEFIAYVKKRINPEAYVEIETNGTIKPSREMLSQVNQWNVSPKLSNSGNPESLRINPEAIKHISDKRFKAVFKFVISKKEDLEEIWADFKPHIKREQIWLMPAGESQKELEQTKALVSQVALDNHYNFTTRLHIDLWNQKTGV